MRSFSLAAILLLAAASASAHENHHGALRLVHPHASPVDEGKSTEIELAVSNTGAADRLVAVETEMGKVELQPVAIPANAKNLVVRAKLASASRTYIDSEMIPATFVFAKAGRVAEEIMIDR